MLGTPLARHREPWETIGKSKEALDAAQWERMQTGRLSEHFWAKSDYVRPPELRHNGEAQKYQIKLFSRLLPQYQISYYFRLVFFMSKKWLGKAFFAISIRFFFKKSFKITH